MKVKTAIAIITSCTSARDALEKLALPRCRLRKLLTSRAFREAMEDYRIVTQAIVTDRAGQFAGWMMGNLAQLTNGDNEDSARKACLAALAQAMDGHIRPPGAGRPPKTALDGLHKELLKLVQIPSSAPGNDPQEPLVSEQKPTNIDK
jgi:uroporphyrinogen-III decarboxylase